MIEINLKLKEIGMLIGSYPETLNKEKKEKLISELNYHIGLWENELSEKDKPHIKSIRQDRIFLTEQFAKYQIVLPNSKINHLIKRLNNIGNLPYEKKPYEKMTEMRDLCIELKEKYDLELNIENKEWLKFGYEENLINLMHEVCKDWSSREKKFFAPAFRIEVAKMLTYIDVEIKPKKWWKPW